MTIWKFISPESTENLVTNPSVEKATTGYTAVSGSIARVLTKQRRGAYSIQMTPTSGSTDGVYYGSVSLTSGVTYTFSVDFFGALGIPYRIYFGSTAAAVLGTPKAFVGTGKWQRIFVTYTETSTTTRRLYVAKNSSSSTAVFYVDGLQLEAKAYATTYCDGDQRGCKWRGGAHLSASLRDGQARSGGREVNLEDYGVVVTSSMGIGMPPSRHRTQERGRLPTKFIGRRIQPRTIRIEIWAGGATISALHALKKSLIDVFKPDLTAGDKPVRMIYCSADDESPTEIDVVYDTGLDGGEVNASSEEIDLRVIAYDDPYFYEQGNKAQTLSTNISLTHGKLLIRKNGVWSAAGVFNGEIKRMIVDASGNLYVCGLFTQIDGVTRNRIAKYDGSAWSSLGTGLSSDAWDMAFAPNGDLYVVGEFATANGVTVNNIAKWNGSTFVALSGGLTGGVSPLAYGVCVTKDNLVFVGGSFTTAGATPAANIAYWDIAAGTWNAIGTGASGQVDSVTTDFLGNVYVGGMFATLNGVTVNKTAIIEFGTVYAMGSGLAAVSEVWRMHFGADKRIYAGTDNGVYRFVGSEWELLTPNIGGPEFDMSSKEDELWVVGEFSVVPPIESVDGVAIWTGFSWTIPDIQLGANGYYFKSVLLNNDDVYLAAETSSVDAKIGAINSINNEGSASTKPKFYFKNDSTTVEVRPMMIKNETTGATIFFNKYLWPGESIEIDIENMTVKSSFTGETWDSVVRSSDFIDFELIPGPNAIKVLVHHTTGHPMTAYIQWRERHWGADGTA